MKTVRRRKLKRRKKEESRNDSGYRKNLIFKLKQNCVSRRGSSYTLACVMVIMISFLLAAMFKYHELTETVENNKRYVSERLDSYMTEYSIEYENYFRNGEAFVEGKTDSTLIPGVKEKLGIKNGKVELGDGVYLADFVLTAISGNQVGVLAEYKLHIPVEFAGSRYGEITVPLKCRSRIVKK